MTMEQAHLIDCGQFNAQVADLEQSDVKVMIFSHWNPSQDVRYDRAEACRGSDHEHLLDGVVRHGMLQE